MVLGGGAFRRWHVHERGATNGVSAPIRGFEKDPLPLLPCKVRVTKRPSMRKWVLTRHPTCGTLTLDFILLIGTCVLGELSFHAWNPTLLKRHPRETTWRALDGSLSTDLGSKLPPVLNPFFCRWKPEEQLIPATESAWGRVHAPWLDYWSNLMLIHFRDHIPAFSLILWAPQNPSSKSPLLCQNCLLLFATRKPQLKQKLSWKLEGYVLFNPMFEELTFQMNNSVEKNDDFHRVEKCNCDFFFFSVFRSGSFVNKKTFMNYFGI